MLSFYVAIVLLLAHVKQRQKNTRDFANSFWRINYIVFTERRVVLKQWCLIIVALSFSYSFMRLKATLDKIYMMQIITVCQVSPTPTEIAFCLEKVLKSDCREKVLWDECMAATLILWWLPLFTNEPSKAAIMGSFKSFFRWLYFPGTWLIICLLSTNIFSRSLSLSPQATSQ